MMLDDGSANPAAHTTSTGPPAQRAPICLVLFLGAGCRPDLQTRAALGRDGLRCLWLPDLGQALGAARLARFDALVLDTAVADGRLGPTLARLREALAYPTIVISATGFDLDRAAAGRCAEDFDEIMALELGADAFLRRPVLPSRLQAHLGAVLRRWQVPTRPVPTQPAAEAAGQREHATQHLGAGLAAVAQNDTQAALLCCLIAAQGRIVTRAELLAALPMGQALRARSLDLHMHRLRRRLASQGATWPCIGAVRGRGYILTAARPASPPPCLAAA